MNEINELKQLRLIRLNTDLENAIGNRDFYKSIGDYNLYYMYDEQIELINDRIRYITGEIR